MDSGSMEFVEEVEKIFHENKSEVYYVELETDISVRLDRNKTPHRLEHKPSKRDTALSEKRLLEFDSRCRFNSHPGEFKKSNYIKIDNTKISPEDVALIVKKQFDL